MRLKGTYHELRHISTQLEDGPYCQRYRDSDVEPTAQDQRVILDGEFIIKTYRFLTEELKL